ncbi:MAG: acyl-CoA dehydrogenase family protein [Chloroflexi bacterium]|nr:acyl-CoA dehydrogenase family protein [Chloroflexota bacterium]
MDFSDTPEDAAFRREVQEFVAKELPPDMRAPDEMTLGVGVGEDPRDMEWLKKLATRGWVAPSWPTEYGGAGLPAMQQFIFNEEMARARAPRPNYIAIGMVGPTTIVHGTEEQKSEHLPGILSGEIYWCQGFSEPESGSDLASLQTRAVEDGDDFIINGQKIWTSGAHRADRMIMLARTDSDGPKHKGLSYFFLDMHAPGVTVRPLTNMAEMHSFNEVFFDNVRVPKKDMLGELNRGWYVALTTLAFERSGIVNAVALQQLLGEIVEATRPYRRAGDVHARNELADRAIEVQVAIMLSHRVASVQAKGQMPIQEASITKLFCSELGQRIARTAVGLAGLYGQLGPGSPWAPLMGRIERTYLIQVGATLAGGTSEIQRNIIATRGLGLPRN